MLPGASSLFVRGWSTYNLPFDPGHRRGAIFPDVPLALREIIDPDGHSSLSASSRENVNDTSDQKPAVQPMSFQTGVNLRQA
jgi:hypothetical protein